MHLLAVQTERSQQRRRELIDHLTMNVDDGHRLVCCSQSTCRASMRAGQRFVEGQLSHVGQCYDLTDDERALRILVVSKQVGGSLEDGGERGHEHVTVDERALQVETAQYGRRPHPRTNHMVGTELALKVLLGLPAYAEPVVQVAGAGSAHVFDCMALVNATLCSRAGRGSGGQGSDEMFVECQSHLRRTIEVLEPTIVLAEGWTRESARGGEPSVAATVSAQFDFPIPQTDIALTVRPRKWGQVAVITAYHPARKWFAVSMPYWQRLEPVLLQARAAALGLT